MNPFLTTMFVLGVVGFLFHVTSRWNKEVKIVATVINVSCLSLSTGALRFGWAEPQQVADVIQIFLLQNVILLNGYAYRKTANVDQKRSLT